MKPLPPDFYERPVLEVARELIGCTVTHGDCAGVIVETEAYHDSEPACHAFAGLTPRTATLFGEPGRAYVYRSYGIHALLNAVALGKAELLLLLDQRREFFLHLLQAALQVADLLVLRVFAGDGL